MKAVAIWNPDKRTKYSFSTIGIRGFVFFNQPSPKEDVKVLIYVNGLKDGLHGIHVHVKSMNDISDPNAANCCDQMGGHFCVKNPWSKTDPHGVVHGEHNGDLCMNIYSENDRAYYSYYDSKISLYGGDPRNIINRTVIIHEDEDDLGKGVYLDDNKNISSLVNGNAGKRLACAEIREILDPDF